ncbi:MAG: SDR family NAD(P)-dependent oxidoreductase [Phycisphaerales bacterium]|nr:SDR family NAD(P)-dependent oxidoreductase [Phycisphaerales bacterium]
MTSVTGTWCPVFFSPGGCTNRGRAIAHRADVSDEGQIAEMFRRICDEFGTIDILVNNAGLQQDAPIEEMTLAQWNKVISVNLTGQFLSARSDMLVNSMNSALIPEYIRSVMRPQYGGHAAPGAKQERPSEFAPPKALLTDSKNTRCRRVMD